MLLKSIAFYIRFNIELTQTRTSNVTQQTLKFSQFIEFVVVQELHHFFQLKSGEQEQIGGLWKGRNVKDTHRQ